MIRIMSWIRHAAFYWFFLIGIHPNAEARLGETEPELVERFGPVKQRDNRFGFIGFIKGEYLVCFQMMDGRAEVMIFGYTEPYTQLHEAQVDHLLQLYSEGSSWREVESSESQVSYEASDGLKFAVWEKAPKTIKRPTLQIMTKRGKDWLKEYQKRYVREKMSGF